MARGAVHLWPYDASRLQPSSVDVTLDRKFRIFTEKPALIDLKADNSGLMELIDVEDHFDLLPGEFVLASTCEVLALNNEHAARVEGKSSLGRLGLLVHATAGFVDPGFYGNVTLELANLTHSTIRLYPGMPIAQVAIFQMAGPARKSYGERGKYAGQTGPTASKYHLNFTS